MSAHADRTNIAARPAQAKEFFIGDAIWKRRAGRSGCKVGETGVPQRAFAERENPWRVFATRPAHHLSEKLSFLPGFDPSFQHAYLRFKKLGGPDAEKLPLSPGITITLPTSWLNFDYALTAVFDGRQCPR
jgi:hypothetical protein